MHRTLIQDAGRVALVAAVVATSIVFALPAGAQRALVPVNGTDCLVVTGTAPQGGPRVLGSRQPLRESFAEGDELLVSGPGIEDYVVGQRLQFVRGYGDIRHPDTNEFIAEAIGWIGFAEVISILGDRALVRVTMSCIEIEAGEYLVAPDQREIADVDHVPDFDETQLIIPDPADATIILGELESIAADRGEARSNMAAREAYGQRDVVIIDQGSLSGWGPGDIVTVYRAELALRAVTANIVYTPTPLSIGLVVAVGDNAAAVLIVEGNTSVQIGDKVRLAGEGGS